MGLLSLDCMAIVTRRVQFWNLQIDITAQKYKNCIKVLIYNGFMALYGYILNDITNRNMKGVAGGGRVRGVGMD